MRRNMGSIDRLLRAFVVAPVLVVLSVALGVWSVLGIVALVLAGVMLVTAAAGVCPGYMPFGIDTRGGISTHGHMRFGGPRPTMTHH